MNTLDRYLAGALISGTALVLLVLLSLSAFINFVGQLDDIGEGTYGVLDAMGYVALSLPSQAFEMIPIATLLGGLVGLGNLASRSELIVMRSAGVSMMRFIGAVALGGLAIVLVAAALGELIAPPAEQYASRHRMLAKNAELSMAGAQNAWAKDGNVIVNVQQLSASGRAGGVYIFTLDPEYRLLSAARAASAGFGADGSWLLRDFRETRFGEEALEARSGRLQSWQSGLSPEILGLSVVDPDSLASRGLYDYVNYLRENELDTTRYEVAFWSRIAGAASVLVMAILPLPFVFGTLRSTGTGQRLTVGALVGVAFIIGSKTLASSGQVFGLAPFPTAWLPTGVLALVTAVGLYRAR